MILISSEINDFSTNEVIDYLLSKNINFLRINREDKCEFKFKKKGIVLEVNEKEIQLNSIKSFWYRRGKLEIQRDLSSKNGLTPFFQNENEILNYYLNQEIGTKKLNSFYTSDPNKLEVLRLAEQFQILTPKTFIIDNKNDVEGLLQEYSIITKGITGSSVFENKSTGEIHLSYTNEITKKSIRQLPDFFFPSMFQEKIDKAYEIRTFFIEEKFWSMAIFSQKNKKTKIDYRNYDKAKPNRKASYILPGHLEKKLISLMRKLNINSGSIDFIVSQKTKELYFLEVNPIGQFGMTSQPCNYNLEQAIFKYLVNETKEKSKIQ